MKIIYFHQHFSTPQGSAGIRSYAMARQLITQGHQVTMVCGSYLAGTTGLASAFLNGSRRGIVDGIEVIEFDLAYSNSDRFFKRAVTFFNFSLRSVWLALTERYDVIFCTTTPLTAAIPGVLARWLRCKPFVFEVRDLWPELPRAMGVIQSPVVIWCLSVLEWVSYHSANRLIALSPGIVDGIVRRGVCRDHIAMIPNGCDLEIFSRNIYPWRLEGVKDSDLIAVFAGTHGLANGLDGVLNAAKVLMSRNRMDIKILLVGQGKLKHALKARAERESLNNVFFLNSISKSQLANLMAGADIGLQVLANVPAFYYGTSPNKFFDYIASALPVLNNYPGWLAELIVEHKCGFAIPPDDPVAFADALEQAADNRQLLEGMGIRAYKLAELSFNRLKLSAIWVDWVTGVSS